MLPRSTDTPEEGRKVQQAKHDNNISLNVTNVDNDNSSLQKFPQKL